jgi:hypothetical protein
VEFNNRKQSIRYLGDNFFGVAIKQVLEIWEAQMNTLGMDQDNLLRFMRNLEQFQREYHSSRHDGALPRAVGRLLRSENATIFVN